MTEIITQKEQTTVSSTDVQSVEPKAEIKHIRSCSKLLVFEPRILNDELVKNLKIKSVRNAFYTGEKPFIYKSDDTLSLSSKLLDGFTAPCTEFTLERDSFAEFIKQFDSTFATGILEESLELHKKLALKDGLEIQFVKVNSVREDYFVLRLADKIEITDSGTIEEDKFKNLVSEYKTAFNVDPNYLEYILLSSINGLAASERLLAAIAEYLKPDTVPESKDKQKEMYHKLNLDEFTKEKMLHLPVYKKETGFFNYSQYQVLNIQTQKLSQPIDMPKPDYLL